MGSNRFLNENLSSVKNFDYKSDVGFELTSLNEYDRYDNYESVDLRFNLHTLNPSLQLFRNNPGRMISKNKNGITSSIEDYVYEYGTHKMPVICETTITFLHNGSTGSFVTHYVFEEI